jgi:hypothetical protein
MIKVHITSPVLPGKRMKTKLEKLIRLTVKDDNCEIRFFHEDKDFYGMLNYQILVVDGALHELNDLRNEILTAILTMLIGK